ncbi:MAG: hypothetical protein QM569_05660 [Acidovorax sp.]
MHCVIVGFGLHDAPNKTIYEYEDIRGQAHPIAASHINPYLIDAPDVLLPSRTETPSHLPPLKKGSQPTDGGHLILTDEERIELLDAEPAAAPWLRAYVGGEELINGGHRWCLWLKNISPAQLKSMPRTMKRVAAVAEARRQSPTRSVVDFADQPTLFTQDRQPAENYLAIPEVSSETRRFIPMGFLPPTIIASNKLQIAEGATLYHFGVLSSTMHNAWIRVVCGRLKSDYSYSPSVYNNFPWPDIPQESEPNQPTALGGLKSEAQAAIETAARGVLDARAQFPDSSLADLYDPLTMPPALLKAHQKLDAAVDKSYQLCGGRKSYASDAERVAFLFERYQQLTSLLPAARVSKPRSVSRKLQKP